MSEEEIIRIVSNLINEVFTGKLINMTKMTESYETNRQAIQGLLDLYNKEKENSKYYKEELDTYYKMYLREKENNEKQLKIDTAEEVLKWKSKYHLLSRKINGVLEDKIKDKIKELEEQCETELLTTWLEAKIEVLEDLLKENNI